MSNSDNKKRSREQDDVFIGRLRDSLRLPRGPADGGGCAARLEAFLQIIIDAVKESLERLDDRSLHSLPASAITRLTESLPEMIDNCFEGAKQRSLVNVLERAAEAASSTIRASGLSVPHCAVAYCESTILTGGVHQVPCSHSVCASCRREIEKLVMVDGRAYMSYKCPSCRAQHNREVKTAEQDEFELLDFLDASSLDSPPYIPPHPPYEPYSLDLFED